jgi:hypothetical protein
MAATRWRSGKTWVDRHGFTASYQSVQRFVRNLQISVAGSSCSD